VYSPEALSGAYEVSPAGAGCAAFHQEAGQHEQSGREGEPERCHVQPRKGHVGGTHLQRYEQVPEEADQKRHDREEDHDRAVHRHQRVVELGQQDASRRHGLREDRTPGHGLARIAQLPSHHHREQAAHDEEEEAHEHELLRDRLVIGGEDVLADERDVVIHVLVRRRPVADCSFRRAHIVLSRCMDVS
jgi:hypothetical protein